MAKQKTVSSYITELKKMIHSRTGADMEPWLLPQVRSTAMNMVVLDKIMNPTEFGDAIDFAIQELKEKYE